jgi:hypothetical protein
LIKIGTTTKKAMVFIWPVHFNYPLRPSSPNTSYRTSDVIDRKSSTSTL